MVYGNTRTSAVITYTVCMTLSLFQGRGNNLFMPHLFTICRQFFCQGSHQLTVIICDSYSLQNLSPCALLHYYLAYLIKIVLKQINCVLNFSIFISTVCFTYSIYCHFLIFLLFHLQLVALTDDYFPLMAIFIFVFISSNFVVRVASTCISSVSCYIMTFGAVQCH